MPAMIDVRCAQCGRRYGFCGRMADCPACPHCGAEPDRAELAATGAKLAETRRLLLSNPTQEICQRQRVLAGLSLGQAAKLLGMERRVLADIEDGRAPLPAELAARMAAVYGVGE
jgi:ribosome-binding protein aMBF1 (putative translation factor)